MVIRAIQQIYIAENSVHTEEILVFKIASEAPFVNDDAERRLSGCASGQFKLRLQMTALSESDEFTVKINERARRNALHDKIRSAVGVKFDFSLIDAAGVNIGDIWRVVGEGIIDVSIVRRAYSYCLPAGRHFDRVPFAAVRVAVGTIAKTPYTVKVGF